MASVRALNSIRNFVDQEISNWQVRGARVSVRESAAGDILIFHCEPLNRNCQNLSNELLRTIKGSMANGLSDIIIDEYEELLVVSLVDGNYGYLAARDREILKKKILRRLDNGAVSSGNLRTYQRSQRKSRVWAKLAEYLEREDQIILEGFITFRLKEYLEELFDLVDHIVEEYLIDREYREFLRLLRHFMKKQKNPLPVINIVRNSDSKYVILDSQLQQVQGDIRLFLERNTDFLGLGIDDLVVSAVVTLAPHEVIWHGSAENSPCFDLINDLFDQTVVVCKGCELDNTEF
ncbi:MAG TPA: hypothetical protein GX524_01505 [Firmicutes bacterium]|nr:hypothetical protein [Bacillota bacterium]